MLVVIEVLVVQDTCAPPGTSPPQTGTPAPRVGEGDRGAGDSVGDPVGDGEVTAVAEAVRGVSAVATGDTVLTGVTVAASELAANLIGDGDGEGLGEDAPTEADAVTSAVGADVTPAEGVAVGVPGILDSLTGTVEGPALGDAAAAIGLGNAVGTAVAETWDCAGALVTVAGVVGVTEDALDDGVIPVTLGVACG